jgi:hypothetical protein
MTGRPIPERHVQQELARARGSRRMLPWTLLTAVGGAALGAMAGGGVGAAAALGALGLGFALFLWVTSIPRCPACGARLPIPRGTERLRGCPRCQVPFE